MLDVRLFGQFEVTRNHRRLIIPTRNAQLLFAYLILNAGKSLRREKLAGILWPESSEENARSYLRHELWRLRKLLESEGDTYFLADDLTIAFRPPCNYSVDVRNLESAAPQNSTAEELIEALSAYRGELLPGFYEEWVTIERERLAALFEDRMTSLLDILQGEGRWAEAKEWALRWTTLSQWPEPAYRALISAYANTGDIANAVETYDRLAQGMQKDLGVAPSEQTRALYKRLKAGWKVAAHPETLPKIGPLPSPSSLAPGASSIPRLRRSNIPRPLTSFIGREREIREVVRQVFRARLVTITGSGGVGKTRLAIQVAEALAAHFRDGAWWVELATLYIPDQALKAGLERQAGTELVLQAVAKVLRVPETPGTSLLEGVIEHLRDRQIILVLDNCEHLIESCANLVERLLEECPEVTVLATSREVLGVPGEKFFLLSSLSLPEFGSSIDWKSIYQSESVNLFIERAADILPGYNPGEAEAPTIAQICLRLDGIPLAIELAAARMNLLSLQEVATRLDHRFNLLTGGMRTALPRHQTLQAAIEWSYDLLSQPEQALFRQLSVFSGSFSLEAAEAVCAGQGIDQGKVLTLLGRLVDKSLLHVQPAPQDGTLSTRYYFLDTICSFGRMILDETNETRSVRERHANYYVRLAESAEPVLLVKDQVRWVKLLQSEYDNIRTVIEWSTEVDQADYALRVISALFWFWWLQGLVREGRDLALKVLGTPSSVQFSHARAKTLNTFSFLLIMLGEIDAANRSLKEALEILRKSNDQVSLAWSLQLLGLALTYEQEYDLADKALQEGLALTSYLQKTHNNSFLFFLGDVHQQKGDRFRALKVYEESVNIFRVIGNKGFMAYPLRRLGYLALEQEDLPNARRYFLESLKCNYETSDMPGLTASLLSMAALALRLEKPIEAARLLGVVENRLEAQSINLLHLDQIERSRLSSQLSDVLDRAVFDVAFSEGWGMSEKEAIALAEEGLGGI